MALTVGCVIAWLVAGCGGNSSTSTSVMLTTNGNNCGSAYGLTSATRQAATICGGVVGYPPVRVTLHRGERFVVRAAKITHVTAFPGLTAHGAAIKLTSRQGSSTHYVAKRGGIATLGANTRYCQKRTHGGCVAFVITVS
jgi:hypothetical protein